MTIYSESQAAVLADLYRRFSQAPDSVDAQWQAFFGDLDAEARAVIEKLNGAPNGGAAVAAAAPAPATAGPVDVGDAGVRAATLDSIRALMLIRAYRVRGHLEANLDPLGPEEDRTASGTRSQELRLHRRRHGPADLHRQRPGPGDRQPAQDRRGGAGDLLRHHRRGVHAHPGPGPEGLDPGAHRIDPQPAGLHGERQAGHPGAPDRGGDLRAVPQQEVHRHQALRPGRRRVHDPGAGADPEARRPARPEGGGHRHAAPRAAQRAGQLHGQALLGDLLGVRGRGRPSRGHRRLRRREVSPRHLLRPRVRRQRRSTSR